MKDSFENLSSHLLTHGGGNGTKAGYSGANGSMQMVPLPILYS
jgi:hypothetical protein